MNLIAGFQYAGEDKYMFGGWDLSVSGDRGRTQFGKMVHDNKQRIVAEHWSMAEIILILCCLEQMFQVNHVLYGRATKLLTYYRRKGFSFYGYFGTRTNVG